MQIQAKVQVNEVSKRVGLEGNFAGTVVKMRAVYGPPNSVNGAWSAATPMATFELYITNPLAGDAFLPGQEYIVSFELAGKED